MKSKFSFFGKKLPAWMILAALVVVGAGAATGLVLKDQIDGTTTIAVSQALYVASVTLSGDGDETLSTIDDDGQTWNAHFEANNGDMLGMDVTIGNRGAQTVVGVITCSVPDGITMSEDTSGSGGPTEIASHTWKVSVPTGAGGDVLDFGIAIEDAAHTGFYEISCQIVPVNY